MALGVGIIRKSSVGGGLDWACGVVICAMLVSRFGSGGVCCSGGDDGIRTRDLGLDRAAC